MCIYILPPYQNFKQMTHSYLFQVNPPFYPSALLLCCDDIKYWSIPFKNISTLLKKRQDKCQLLENILKSVDHKNFLFQFYFEPSIMQFLQT